jgi:hypothetical protein
MKPIICRGGAGVSASVLSVALPRCYPLPWSISHRILYRPVASCHGDRQVSVMLNGYHRTTAPSFWSGNGAVLPAPRWHESNCALARLLAKHRRVLAQAVAVAAEIRRGIDELAPLMEALCRRTCRFCPEPCCIVNTVWIDFRDLLFLHLLEAPIPPVRPQRTRSGLSVFEPSRMPPSASNPAVDVHPVPICPAQRVILKKKGQPATTALAPSD